MKIDEVILLKIISKIPAFHRFREIFSQKVGGKLSL